MILILQGWQQRPPVFGTALWDQGSLSRSSAVPRTMKSYIRRWYCRAGSRGKDPVEGLLVKILRRALVELLYALCRLWKACSESSPGLSSQKAGDGEIVGFFDGEVLPSSGFHGESV